MIERIIAQLAPHYCVQCGVIGSGLCQVCKKSVHLRLRQYCTGCSAPLQGHYCPTAHCVFYAIKQYVVAEYSDIVRRLLKQYKYEYRRAYSNIFVAFLQDTVPPLSATSQLVPLPTSPRHIRQRGYDHIKRIAYTFVKYRNMKYTPLLVRRHNLRQVGASREVRFLQAADAFYCKKSISPEIEYILFDDVITTGATMAAAITALRKAGARQCTIIAIAHQPLESTH